MSDICQIKLNFLEKPSDFYKWTDYEGLRSSEYFTEIFLIFNNYKSFIYFFKALDCVLFK